MKKNAFNVALKILPMQTITYFCLLYVGERGIEGADGKTGESGPPGRNLEIHS